MADGFKFDVNADDVADQLGTTVEAIQKDLVKAVETISGGAHAFIIQKANQDLSHNTYLRDAFLGYGDKAKSGKESDKHPLVSPDAKHVRWNKIGSYMWVIEIDESARYIEEGRSAVSMATEDWLLKPGKAKKAKDGSTYRVIPMPAGGTSSHEPSAQGAAFLKHSLRSAIKKAGVKMSQIERDPSGQPKFGVVASLDVSKFEAKAQDKNIPGTFSKPRSPADAAATGLKAHEGNFMIGGAAVIQRPADNKAGVKKEAVVFRVVSSKHQNEDRWMYPEVKPLNSLEAAYEWAKQEWEEALKMLEEKYRNR
jgi:hypothetical protein